LVDAILVWAIMTNITHQRSRTPLPLAGKCRSWNFVEIANKANDIVACDVYKDLFFEFLLIRDPISMSVMLGTLTDRFGEHPIFSYYYGFVWDLLGDKDKAYDCFYDALGLPRWSQFQKSRYNFSDELGYAVFWLAEYRRSKGDLEAAKRTLSMMPTSTACMALENMALAEIHIEEGDYSAAIEALSRAYGYRGEVNILMQIAKCQSKLGQHRAAASTYQEALDLGTGNEGVLLYGMGYALMQCGEIDQAISAFRKSHTLVSDFVYTPNNIAYLLALKCKASLAIKYAHMAVCLDSSIACPHDTMAFAYLADGQNELALESALKAISLDWRHAEAWYHAGVANWRLGNQDKAREIFRKLLSMDLAWAGYLATEMSADSEVVEV
jgi:tetratricopeptide (TPR) repeat protein